jgi:ribosomal protein S18 acetylase RimI-like enzyme
VGEVPSAYGPNLAVVPADPTVHRCIGVRAIHRRPAAAGLSAGRPRQNVAAPGEHPHAVRVSHSAASQVAKSERARAIATLVSAFVADPAERWLYPDANEYLTHFPVFVAAFGGRAFEESAAWQFDDFAAVSLWLPPGVESDGDTTIEVLTASVSPVLHDDLFVVLGQMGDAHPTYPHWYLPWFGVDAARQRLGLGGELLTHCLTLVDATHHRAYLESTNPRNVPFYERHGFEVSGTAQAGTSPSIVLMTRAAR